MRGALTMAMVAGLAPVPACAEVATSFCERMAQQTGMTAAPAKPGEPRLYTMRTMNLAQRFLVGGSTTVMMGMAPAPGEAASDHPDLVNACKGAGKGIACTIQGPSDFRLTVNGKDLRVPAKAGEKAEVGMQGSRITCKEG